MSMIPRPARSRCRRVVRRARTAAARTTRKAIRRAVRFVRRYAWPIAVGVLLAVLIGLVRTAALGVGVAVVVVYTAARGLVRLLDRVEAHAPRVHYAGGAA